MNSQIWIFDLRVFTLGVQTHKIIIKINIKSLKSCLLTGNNIIYALLSNPIHPNKLQLQLS